MKSLNHHRCHRCCPLISIALLLLALVFKAQAAPTVTVTTPTPGATVSTLTSIAITFNEAVTDVDANDLNINGESATFVTGSGAGPYSFTFTQPLPGTVTVDWIGDHGIAGQSGSGAFAPGPLWNYTLTDTIAPTVLERTPAAGATVGGLTRVEITFSEPVLGVDAGDLLINDVAATGMTGSGFGPYIFTFSQPATGTVTFSWAAGHGIQDLASPANNFAGGNWTTTLSATGIGNLVINEFLSSNGIGILDENGDQEDWIEIYNPGPNPVNLSGWALTSDDTNLGEWVFPAWSLNAGQYMIVYASAKNRKPPQTTAGVDNANTIASPRLHTNFTINENGGYLALTSPESPRTVVTGFVPYPEQRTDFSYGSQPAGGLRYFSPPTPKAANNPSTITGVTPRVSFSVNRGFFKDPFQLVLTCSDPAATIRYTTNFTEPTAGNGIVYTAPVSISGTTNVRAAAFSAGKIPSFPVTHSYIYLDQVLTQSDSPAGFPPNWGSHATFTGGVVPKDYGIDMDPVRVNPDSGTSAIDPVKLQRLKDGLRELPIVSITLPINDMFGSAGLYYYPNVTNKAFGYKKCAVEMILPDGSSAFSVVCGIGGHGNASRDPLKNPKHGFQLKFKGDYGESSLDYQLFSDSPVTEYDDIILRPDFNSSWRHWSDDTSNTTGFLQRSRGTRIRDAWSKNTFRDMGGLASHHRFFHMFINGLYWGTYDFAEQPVEGFAQELMGGAKADYAIVQEGGFLNGNDSVYTSMAGMPNITSNSLYEQMKVYLDVPEFIDYMLLHFYIGHQDWGTTKNWYAIRRRATPANPTQGKYQYVPWDQECTLLDPSVNRVAAGHTLGVPSDLQPKLILHPQYRLDFADRVHRHMIAPGGALTPSANIARWQKWQAIMDKPIVAESARWGDYRRDVHQYQTGSFVLYTREGHFLPECNRLTTSHFPNRGVTVLSQLQSVGLYPSVAAPQLRDTNAAGPIVGSKQVSAGYALAMTNPSGTGTIHYTTDGNDPHIYYTPTTGATASSIAPTATAYTVPITINSTTTVKARVLNATGTWTALNEATFTVGLALPSIRITEIMYNPPGGAAHEFLEIQNTGTTAVDLSAWYFEGIEFYFPLGSVLNAGDRLLLANNDGKFGIFATQYPGVTPFGWFAGSLDNAGERIALLDANGRVIAAVAYDDATPWSTAADGSGVSLEIVDPSGNPNDPFNWKASNTLKGTPGTPNSPPASQSVQLSELFASGSDFIELHNTTGAPVSIGNWVIRGSAIATITAGTTVPANGYQVINLTLPPREGTLAIYTDSSLTTRVDGVSWGNQVAGHSIGRVSGNWTLCTPTSGATNVEAAVAPPSNLAINEWLANPLPGASDWVELYNKHATLPVALAGVHVKTSTQIFPIQALTFVAPQGWVQLLADQQPGGNHLGLKLPTEGTTLSLVDITNTTFDSITYGAQEQPVTSGRLPDGIGAITAFPGSASPGAANYLASSYTGPVLNEVLARNGSSGMAPWGTHVDWCEVQNPSAGVADLGGMRLGRINDFDSAWPIPAGTNIPANGFLAFWCDASRAADTVADANLNTGFALGDFSDGLYLFNSAGQLVSFIEWGAQVIDRSIGRDAGQWKLLSSPTRAAANLGAATLGLVTNVKINEWASALALGDWFELYNLDANPVSIGGLYLTDDPGEVGRTKFQIAPLSFLGGNASASAWVQLLADGLTLIGRNHVNFQLDASAEYLRLSNNDANLTSIDSVSFGLQTTTATQGRIVDGQSIQVGLIPTPGAKNLMVPIVTGHPQPTTVAANSPASFSAMVVGSEPLTFQWRRNGADLQNAVANPLQIMSAAENDDGLYDLVVTNTVGNVTSQSARLFVQLTFDQWRSGRFTPGELADPNLSGLAADFDQDGLSNAQEYFHNLNPKQADGGVGRIELGREPATGPPTFLTLTYRQNARLAGLTLQHQASPGLEVGSWLNVTPTVTNNIGTDAVTGDPIVRVKFGITPGEGKKFLRLQLTP